MRSKGTASFCFNARSSPPGSTGWRRPLRVMSNPSASGIRQSGDGRFFTTTAGRRNDVFREFMLNSPASEIAATLLRSDKLNQSTSTYW